MIKNKINISMIIKLFICLILLIILTIFVVNKTFIKDNYKNIQIPRFSYFIKDKNQEKREQLHKQIIQLENQEEDLLVLKRRYEEKVMDFRTDIWTMNAQIENLIDPVSETSSTNRKIWEENQALQQTIDSYVEQELDNVSKQTRKVQQKLDENREKLTKERNSLPWE